MISISEIRTAQNQIVVFGLHQAIIQSILDFDYLCGKNQPSIVAIIVGEQGKRKFFWGHKEILLPTYSDASNIPQENLQTVWFVNLLSGRRVLTSILNLVNNVPKIAGGSIFAEGVLEKHSVDLYKLGLDKKTLLIGPSSVGLVIPSVLKLGAIGGIDGIQMYEAGLNQPGSVAVISASGGMTNELINLVHLGGKSLSFALSTGGDRFPLPDITTVINLAQNDPQTKTIVYYGELGGVEEYKLVELKKTNKLQKPVIVYIAGTVGELFEDSPQFGHAKAKANSELEKASNKRKALSQAGFLVASKFSHLLELIKQA